MANEQLVDLRGSLSLTRNDDVIKTTSPFLAAAADVLVTREIVHAGKLLDVDVLDHLIIGHGVWVSLCSTVPGYDPVVM